LAATIAVIAPGAMGSAVGRRLAEHGARVLTLLDGRSEPTAQRARAAGMIGVAAAELAEADLILSIVPPGEALGLAASLAPVLRRSRTKPAFVDCNAINPDTMKQPAEPARQRPCAGPLGAAILRRTPGGGGASMDTARTCCLRGANRLIRLGIRGRREGHAVAAQRHGVNGIEQDQRLGRCDGANRNPLGTIKTDVQATAYGTLVPQLYLALRRAP
jgi:hypothetical protein